MCYLDSHWHLRSTCLRVHFLTYFYVGVVTEKLKKSLKAPETTFETFQQEYSHRVGLSLQSNSEYMF